MLFSFLITCNIINTLVPLFRVAPSHPPYDDWHCGPLLSRIPHPIHLSSSSSGCCKHNSCCDWKCCTSSGFLLGQRRAPGNIFLKASFIVVTLVFFHERDASKIILPKQSYKYIDKIASSLRPHSMLLSDQHQCRSFSYVSLLNRHQWQLE